MESGCGLCMGCPRGTFGMLRLPGGEGGSSVMLKFGGGVRGSGNDCPCWDRGCGEEKLLF